MAEERELMLDVAISYYLDDKSKVDIASQLGLSRFKVARLLEQARDEGLVRITIVDGVIRGPLSDRLAQHLQLDRAIKTPSQTYLPTTMPGPAITPLMPMVGPSRLHTEGAHVCLV